MGDSHEKEPTPPSFSKMNLDHGLILYTTINSKRTSVLNVSSKTIKHEKKTCGGCLTL